MACPYCFPKVQKHQELTPQQVLACHKMPYKGSRVLVLSKSEVWWRKMWTNQIQNKRKSLWSEESPICWICGALQQRHRGQPPRTSREWSSRTWARDRNNIQEEYASFKNVTQQLNCRNPPWRRQQTDHEECRDLTERTFNKKEKMLKSPDRWGKYYRKVYQSYLSTSVHWMPSSVDYKSMPHWPLR